jgi:hypothetical protein
MVLLEKPQDRLFEDNPLIIPKDWGLDLKFEDRFEKKTQT